ncbi:hypothetical protein ABMA70_06415 [Halobacteriovorax sp. XZX-3]|uniref:hypothetical protein n=1 Tax=unclassified Halobacteriovorax TaxID=2639665 RepID=UPI000CD23EAA|nr:hypothetical protein [Halobacteriovorax sp. DA5]POB14873.1 hypothetical protein C0Z22_00435 [Halobacteriovorax sp. DA5]
MGGSDKVLYVSYVYSEEHSLFFIRSIFTAKSSIDFNEVELGPRMEITSDGYLSGFFDEEELTKFAYDLSDRLKQDKVCLISPECFNKVLEVTKKIGGLLEAFIEHGNVLENPERTKKGFLSSFIR